MPEPTWTTTRPTTEGVWWLREWDDYLGRPCSVDQAYIVTHEDVGGIDPRSLWAGPIKPPPE